MQEEGDGGGVPRLRREEAMNVTLNELARLVGGKVAGDGSTAIHGVNGIKEAGVGEITFLANKKYSPLLASTRASAVIVAEGVKPPLPAISVNNPDLAFARVAEHFNGGPLRLQAGIHPSASVAPGASLGKDVSVGAGAVIEPGASVGDGTVLYPQVYVGHGAKIGRECVIYPQVVIRERCEIGSRVILHSGAVVGSDGFGFVTEDGVHKKIPQTGIVVIEDDVEIGANVAIARARFDRTVICRGAKIDNLVQIAHNVVVGEGSLLAAQVGIAGSTKLGRHVVVGGQAGLTGHIEIGDGAGISAQAGVGKDVPAGRMFAGAYAVELKSHLKQLASLAKLPEALAEIRRLRAEIDEMKKARP